jgi:hypothetical protein
MPLGAPLAAGAGNGSPRPATRSRAPTPEVSRAATHRPVAGESALGHGGAAHTRRMARRRHLEEFRHRSLTNIACSTTAYGGDSLRWSRARALPMEACGGSAANEPPHLAAGATTHAADEVLHPWPLHGKQWRARPHAKQPLPMASRTKQRSHNKHRCTSSSLGMAPWW